LGTRDEIIESNRHLREAWKLYAQVSRQVEVLDTGCLSFANANQPWFFMNVAALNEPVADGSDLQRRARKALTYFAVRGNPWVLTASEDWLGADATSLLSHVGLAHKLDLMGMATARVSPASRPFPDVQLRQIDDEETRFARADLNAGSYGVPNEWGGRRLAGPRSGRGRSSGG